MVGRAPAEFPGRVRAAEAAAERVGESGQEAEPRCRADAAPACDDHVRLIEQKFTVGVELAGATPDAWFAYRDVRRVVRRVSRRIEPDVFDLCRRGLGYGSEGAGPCGDDRCRPSEFRRDPAGAAGGVLDRVDGAVLDGHAGYVGDDARFQANGGPGRHVLARRVRGAKDGTRGQLAGERSQAPKPRRRAGADRSARSWACRAGERVSAVRAWSASRRHRRSLGRRRR